MAKAYVTRWSGGTGLGAVLRGLVAPERVRIEALVDVDLTIDHIIDHGELVTLLGPDGAGKSTLIKVLTEVISAPSMVCSRSAARTSARIT